MLSLSWIFLPATGTTTFIFGELSLLHVVLFCLFLIVKRNLFPNVFYPLTQSPIPGSHEGYLPTGVYLLCPIHLNWNELCGRIILKYQLVLLVCLFPPHVHVRPCPSPINHLAPSCLLSQGREDNIEDSEFWAPGRSRDTAERGCIRSGCLDSSKGEDAWTHGPGDQGQAGQWDSHGCQLGWLVTRVYEAPALSCLRHSDGARKGHGHWLRLSLYHWVKAQNKILVGL